MTERTNDTARHGRPPKTMGAVKRTPGADLLGIEAATIGDLINVIRKGLPTSSVRTLAAALELTQDKTLQLVDIPSRTFSRRVADTGTLDAPQGERTVRLARVTAKAHAVMGQHGGNRWLQSRWPAFDGHTPVEYARTDLGAEAVIDLINALEDGIFV